MKITTEHIIEDIKRKYHIVQEGKNVLLIYKPIGHVWLDDVRHSQAVQLAEVIKAYGVPVKIRLYNKILKGVLEQ